MMDDVVEITDILDKVVLDAQQLSTSLKEASSASAPKAEEATVCTHNEGGFIKGDVVLAENEGVLEKGTVTKTTNCNITVKWANGQTKSMQNQLARLVKAAPGSETVEILRKAGDRRIMRREYQ